MKCPCNRCERRTLTCHGVCREYEDWKIERAAINDYNREKNQLTVSMSVLRKSWKNKRYQSRKYAVNK